MPTKDFAQQIVSNALRKNPPRYMLVGRGSWLVLGCLRGLNGSQGGLFSLICSDYIHPNFRLFFIAVSSLLNIRLCEGLNIWRGYSIAQGILENLESLMLVNQTRGSHFEG